MDNYVQIIFKHLQPEQQDLLIAYLSEAGYEGFEETGNELKAFISENSFDDTLLNELAIKHSLSFTQDKIKSQNWNEVWESNFQPVIIDDFVAIRASFHKPVPNVQYEIIITPKMSFGTGHHATTYMMIQQMRKIDFASKSVLDFGTGTGVLAILAEKLGAKEIVALDNDEWSIANALENIQNNNCSCVTVIKADSAKLDNQFDIILANINKNVILDNLPNLVKQLKTGGAVLLSGLLLEDRREILEAISSFGIECKNQTERNNWLCFNASVKSL